jgi:alpha-beta hydrolase superfamily lysophospholipase
VHWYEGLWHEIYNEPERDGPLSDLREWLAAHR